MSCWLWHRDASHLFYPAIKLNQGFLTATFGLGNKVSSEILGFDPE
jgi:hypothetical protein